MIRTHVVAFVLIGLLGISGHRALGQGAYYDGNAIVHMQILINPEIQKDLMLDAFQVAKAREAYTEASRRYRELVIVAFKGATDEERKAKIPGVVTRLMNDQRGDVSRFLSLDQLRRYDQVVLLQHCPWSLLDPEVAGKLKLTEEQLDKIRAIGEESIQKRRELVAAIVSKTIAPPASVERLQSIRQEANDKATDVLDEGQKATWAGMIGAPSVPE